MKKIISVFMATFLMVGFMTNAFAAYAGKMVTLSSGQASSFTVSLNKGEKVTIKIEQTGDYIPTDGGYVTEAYNPYGYETSVGFSINSMSTGKNKFYKSMTLNKSKSSKKYKTYTFKASATDTYCFTIRNNTKLKKGYWEYKSPTYRVTVQ